MENLLIGVGGDCDQIAVNWIACRPSDIPNLAYSRVCDVVAGLEKQTLWRLKARSHAVGTKSQVTSVQEPSVTSWMVGFAKVAIQRRMSRSADTFQLR